MEHPGHTAGEQMEHPGHTAGEQMEHPGQAGHTAAEQMGHPGHTAAEQMEHPGHQMGQISTLWTLFCVTASFAVMLAAAWLTSLAAPIEFVR
jgi:hypothetical protein